MDAAMKRAWELYYTLNENIPQGAKDYTDKLINEYGYCGEIVLTGFAHYAQYVEGLACTNEDYLLTDKDRMRFSET